MSVIDLVLAVMGIIVFIVVFRVLRDSVFSACSAFVLALCVSLLSVIALHHDAAESLKPAVETRNGLPAGLLLPYEALAVVLSLLALAAFAAWLFLKLACGTYWPRRHNRRSCRLIHREGTALDQSNNDRQDGSSHAQE